jgi:hypothetical protein
MRIYLRSRNDNSLDKNGGPFLVRRNHNNKGKSLGVEAEGAFVRFVGSGLLLFVSAGAAG